MSEFWGAFLASLVVSLSFFLFSARLSHEETKRKLEKAILDRDEWMRNCEMWQKQAMTAHPGPVNPGVKVDSEDHVAHSVQHDEWEHVLVGGDECVNVWVRTDVGVQMAVLAGDGVQRDSWTWVDLTHEEVDKIVDALIRADIAAREASVD